MDWIAELVLHTAPVTAIAVFVIYVQHVSFVGLSKALVKLSDSQIELAKELAAVKEAIRK